MRARVLTSLVAAGLGLIYVGSAMLRAQDAPAAAPAPAAPAAAKSADAAAKADDAATDDMSKLKDTLTAPPAAPAGTPPAATPVATPAPAAVPTVVPVPDAAATATASTNQTVVLDLPKKDDEKITGAHASTNAASEDLIDITLEDVPMAEVVRMFTRLSKANIIASPSNLNGQVTVNLIGVKWKPALECILDMNNMQLVEKPSGSGMYQIIGKQPGVEPMRVQTFFLKYAAVSNVQGVVQGMLRPGGTLSAFPSRNAIVVRSTADNIGDIESVVKGIDKLRDQVFIEAKFMELRDDAIRNLGINWQVLKGYDLTAGTLAWGVTENRQWSRNINDTLTQWDKRQNVDTLNKQYNMNNLQMEPAPPSTRTVADTIDKAKNIQNDTTETYNKTASDIRTAVLGAKDFSLILSALKEMSGVNIVSNPKVIVANEQAAIIHIGEIQRPFVSSVTPGANGVAPVVTYNPGNEVRLGIRLTVTPTINTESNITVRIEPELTRFVRNDTAPNGQTYPIITTKRVETTFCLESGRTVAIGGLTELDDRDTSTKIPLLGDIPLIGKYLFSHSNKTKTQQETIIFVTVAMAFPEGIQQNTGLPEDTELTQRHMLKSQARKAEYMAELEVEKEAVESKVDRKNQQKVKSRLMKQKN
ncbi:MAG: hypothetical protein C0404_03620 [Verrucomicrobia bacterium]|nr:hypothetical protein [Verrucomicrobiota bacterium]